MPVSLVKSSMMVWGTYSDQQKMLSFFGSAEAGVAAVGGVAGPDFPQAARARARRVRMSGRMVFIGFLLGWVVLTVH